MAKEILTAEYLRDRLSYDKDTGLFTHNKTFGSRFKAGDRADTPGHAALIGYRLVNLLSRKYLGHRAAWLHHYGAWPDGVIDHINGDKGDNRICNLRDVTHQVNNENRRNKSHHNKTGFMGVIVTNGKFRARILVNRKNIHIGMFDTPEEANLAYIEAKRIYHAGCTL